MGITWNQLHQSDPITWSCISQLHRSYLKSWHWRKANKHSFRSFNTTQLGYTWLHQFPLQNSLDVSFSPQIPELSPIVSYKSVARKKKNKLKVDCIGKMIWKYCDSIRYPSNSAHELWIQIELIVNYISRALGMCWKAELPVNKFLWSKL
jgi:hypothetical protein